ncbi:MAG TPA: ribonucleoside triphosphate reductase, partial [Candidatus Moranbacteria bacterium]|nr:ribonucleoside triphosphate reductase [Candidatus Moranbacteria bacterium]
YRLARIDKEKYPEIIFANNKEVRTNGGEPYYTNSSHLPVHFTEDIFEALDLQDELQTKYTGGTVLHGFLGEKVSDIETTKNLVRKIAESYTLPYFTLTPTFSICPAHGYLEGEHYTCPKCVVKQKTEVYSRVVGYIRPVEQWNKGKQAEFEDRKEYVADCKEKKTNKKKKQIVVSV